MEMLQLNDLHKTFNPGTVNEKVALNGVSLHMEAGDFATIVGSNGAGKSTLFNAITGGFIADEGSILLGGQDITFAPEHQRSKVIGHLFQDPLKGTAPNMTIEENLALAYLRAGTAPHAIFSRIIGVAFGSCLYRFIVAVALRFNVPAAAMKLVSAIIVAIAISMPAIKEKIAFEQRKHGACRRRVTTGKEGK